MLTQDEITTLLIGSKAVFEKVYPPLAKRGEKLILGLANIDLPFGAFMGLRSFLLQDDLYAQGRWKPGKIVTNAKGGQSWHNFGLALDMVEDGDMIQGGIQWSWSKNLDYLKVGTIAQAVGLEWGGFWKAFKDYPHVQLTGGLTLEEANKLYLAKRDLKVVWEEVDRRLLKAA